MPKIPQNYADQRLQAGPLGPEADALAFNPSSGLERVGQGLANAGESLERIGEKKKIDDEYRWLVNSTHQYNLEAVKFENDPANHSREDFGQATLDYLEQRKKEYLKQAPSQRASARLTAQLDNVIESRFQRASAQGEHTKLTNAQLEIDKSISDAMQGYRADASTSPDYAAKNLEPQMDLLKESVLARWGKSMPQATNKFLEHIETQFVAGTAEHDPAYARKLLGESTFIDETRRATLLNHIEAQEKSGNRLAVWSFHDSLREAVNYGWDTHQLVKEVPLAAFEAVHGKGKDAEYAKAQFDQQRGEANQASAFIARVSGLNSNTVQTEFDKFTADPKISHDAKAKLEPQIHALLRQAQTDSFGYVAANNEEVRKAYDFAMALPPEQRSDGMARANKIALEYQGYAPDGTPASEQLKYLNLATNARHLMSAAQASRNVQDLTKGTPDQQVAVIGNLMVQFPEEQRAIAFNDLVTLPKLHGKEGIEQGLQWAFLHRDKPWVKEFIGAQQNESIKKRPDDQMKDYQNALFSNPHWLGFQQALIGDSFQRADEVEGYRRGLLNYAVALREIKGADSPAAAVKLAASRLIDTEFGTPTVAGVTTLIARKTRTGGWLNDQDVKDTQLKLNAALRMVPHDQVRLESPDGRSLFTIFPKEIGAEPLQKALPRIISTKGLFVPTPDGAGATLHLKDDTGTVFQLLDKSNQPWEVEFSTLPPLEWRDATVRPYEGGWKLRTGHVWKNWPPPEYKVGPGMQPLP